jgi:type I restriction enzyme, R subunit
MANQNLEQILAYNTDNQFINYRWIVQSIKQNNLNAGIGVVIKEYLIDVSPADYVLFVEGKPCGVVEAKREEEGRLSLLFSEKIFKIVFQKLHLLIESANKKKTPI